MRGKQCRISVLIPHHKMRDSRRRSGQAVVLETRVVTGSGGGPDKTILNSPRHLWSAGYETLCAYMHPPADPGFVELRRKADACSAPLISIPDRGAWDLQVATQLLRVCRRERVAIWHGHDYKSNALGLLLRRFWPMKLVTTVHGWVKKTRRTPLYYKIDNLCLPRFDAVLCVSNDLREHCLSRGVPADRCSLIENGIDTVEYTRSEESAHNRASAARRRLVIGAVGRLSDEKGFDILIRAVHRLVQDGIDVELRIAGAGDAKQSLQRLTSELGVASRVRLVGHVADTRRFYESLDVFALSSRREGLPNVVLEALAMEVPVVATRVNGVPRLIRDGATGVLVDPESVDALAGGLMRILGDSDLRAKMAAAGRREVELNYSFTARMEKVRAVYDWLLDRA